MTNFICVNRQVKNGVNWRLEIREYELRRKWWQRFLKISTSFVMKAGDFYFPVEKIALPKAGNDSMGSGLGEFIGEKYIKWSLKNTTGRVRLYCKRNWCMSEFGDIDECEIALGFSDEIDAMAFKLRWV